MVLSFNIEGRLSEVLMAISATLTASGAIIAAQSLAQLEIQEALESRREHKKRLDKLAERIIRGDAGRIVSNAIGLEKTKFDILYSEPCDTLEALKDEEPYLLKDLDTHLEGKPISKLLDVCRKHKKSVKSLDEELDEIASRVVDFVVQELGQQYKILETYDNSFKEFVKTKVLAPTIRTIHNNESQWTLENIVKEARRIQDEIKMEVKLKDTYKGGMSGIDVYMYAFKLVYVKAHLPTEGPAVRNNVLRVFKEVFEQKLASYAKDLVDKVEETSSLTRSAEEIKKLTVNRLYELREKTYLPNLCQYVK
ncbi:hypothetical protein APE_0825.1 [Aeropyrum pernix spindle-shaped virus 1]|uniref:Uncharacterized protein n=1 Tax=Aeropyrum pernix (strain ATCC 700893 / DSM 11879 / JCM 9820 / NBRC 100138 / K1) TaxID=272557 RepID=Q9YDU3_AERPE|nr:hypothetical protein [Aeropyrum pernix]BAA79804.2 hypothetical protein APE_0825.1 [Aeropyrum pernix spindle-shaped virus 1] [Aeropyrum pernix K1]